MKKIVLAMTLAVGLLQADFNDFSYRDTSVGVQSAIYGLGATIKSKVHDNIALKASFDTFSINDYEVEDDTTKYNFDLKLQDFMLVGDYHPWAGSFKISTGMIVNNSVLDGDITPNDRGQSEVKFTFEGKDYTYKVSELGAIETKVDFDPVAPYVGIGWDTSFDKKSGFGFTFDLGVAYQGAAQASYKLRYGDALDVNKATADLPDGPQKEAVIREIEAKKAEIDSELKSALDEEMVSLQEELDKYEWLPYISIGFNYKF